MNNIVGVRYIGKKENHEDSLLNTGAVWSPGQVHNFHESIARRLLEHSGTYEEAPVSAAGETFMSGGKDNKGVREPVAYVNINGMDKEQLAVFAKREFLRHVETEGRSDDDVRAEVHRLMTMHNMDEIAAESMKGEKGGFKFTILVNADEYEALVAGDLVVRLVPAEALVASNHEADQTSVPAENGSQEAPTQREQAGQAQAEAAASASGEQTPTLDELLASLNEDGLIAFAKQEGVAGINKRMKAETMREKIRETLTAKAG